MTNILVTGASGIIGYGILRSLKKSNKTTFVIGSSIYTDSIAEAFCDKFEQAPPTNSTEYISWLLNIINTYKVDMIIPGIEADMYEWNQNLKTLNSLNIKLIVNNNDLIELCRDKWLFYNAIKDIPNTPAIPSSLDNDFNVLINCFDLPFILKPRNGHGSKGIKLIETQEEFSTHSSKIGSYFMVQPKIGNDDEEYSSSAFCDGNGSYFSTITLKRKLSKQGYTENAEVIEIPEINKIIDSLCKLFKPIGPTNFQFRKLGEKYKLLEINPRISSSTSIRTAFGYNEAEMCIEYFIEKKIPNNPKIKMGKAIRYIEDYVVYE